MSAAPSLAAVDSMFDQVFAKRAESSVPSATAAGRALDTVTRALSPEAMSQTSPARIALASLIGRTAAIAFLLEQRGDADSLRQAAALADALRECAEVR